MFYSRNQLEYWRSDRYASNPSTGGGEAAGSGGFCTGGGVDVRISIVPISISTRLSCFWAGGTFRTGGKIDGGATDGRNADCGSRTESACVDCCRPSRC